MLPPSATALGRVVGAIAAWLTVLLLAQELGYLFEPLEFLATRSGFLIAVGTGFLITLWVILSRSAVRPLVPVALGVAAVAGFAVAAFVGLLFVACANGECL